MAALLALLAAVGWGSSDYAAGSASRRSSAVSVVILTHFAAVVALCVVALDFGPLFSTFGDGLETLRSPSSVGGLQWSGPAITGEVSLGDLLWGLAAGLGGGAGAMLLFRGLGRGSMAVVAPITASGAASIPAVYGIVRGEPVTFLTVLGIALALVAIVLLSMTDGDEVPAGVAADHGGQPVGRARVREDPDWPTWARANPIEAERASAWLDTQLALRTQPGHEAQPGSDGSVSSSPTPGDLRRGPVDDLTVPDVWLRLRRLRRTIIVSTAVALLAAAVALAGPVRSMVRGGGLAAGDVASLVLAFVVVGIAWSAASTTRLMLETRAHPPLHLERRADPSSFDVRNDRVERRIDPSSLRMAGLLRQPGVPEALLSGVGFGMFFVFISRAGESSGFWPLVGARSVSVVMFTIAALVTSTAVLPVRGSRRWVVLAGVLDAAAAVFFVLSTRAGLLSVGAVLASLYPVVTVLLARVVGGERIRRQQLVGLALAMGAASVLAV